MWQHRCYPQMSPPTLRRTPKRHRSLDARVSYWRSISVQWPCGRHLSGHALFRRCAAVGLSESKSASRPETGCYPPIFQGHMHCNDGSAVACRMNPPMNAARRRGSIDQAYCASRRSKRRVQSMRTWSFLLKIFLRPFVLRVVYKCLCRSREDNGFGQSNVLYLEACCTLICIGASFQCHSSFPQAFHILHVIMAV